jgi:hypothetical protein
MPPRPARPFYDFLLDERRLEGLHAVTRAIGSELQAVMVDERELDDAVEAIANLSQIWSGGGAALIAVEDFDEPLRDIWAELLRTGQIDAIVARDLYSTDDIMRRVCGLPLSPGPAGPPIYALLAGERSRGEEPAAIDVSLPDREDPWFVSYLAALGTVPDEISPWLLSRSGLDPSLDLDELITFEESQVDDPGGVDLLARVAARRDARTLTLHRLGVGSAYWSQDLVTQPTWDARGWTAAFCGSNIVVVYEPGSVADLCLIWNLRAVHGHYPGLPLGVPNTADVGAVLGAWTDREAGSWALQLRGIGRPFAITSLSVSHQELTGIAGEVGTPWEVFPAADLSQSPVRPVILSSDTATFVDGAATLDAWDVNTRNLFESRPRHADGLNLHIGVALQNRPLPPLPALRLGSRAMSPSWRGGGFERQLPQVGHSIRLEWPRGISVLAAAASRHGLRVRPSTNGLAATAFIRRLGQFQGSDPLKDQRILLKLDELAESRGASYYRKEIRRIRAQLASAQDDASLDLLDRVAGEARTATTQDDAHDLTVEALPLKRASARAWIEWAEGEALIIRGTNVRCDTCPATHWRSAAELGPPIVCPGCGQAIARPFPPDRLPFRYRPSAALLQLMADDALPHVLAASWWVAYMPNGLYGVHPGLEFLDHNDQVIGEADVVLLLTNGRIALGEVKRRGAGLNETEVDRLERLADRLDAAWTFYGTPQYAADCPEIWQTVRRDLPDRRRVALAGEQLLTPSRHVLAVMGADATAWDPLDAKARKAREEFFEQHLPELVSQVNRPQRLDDQLGPAGQASGS